MPFIDSSYFIGERDIPNTEQAAVNSLLDNLIRVREKEYLEKSLGYELSKLFNEGLQVDTPAQRYTDLLFGKEYTLNGILKKWPGFVSVTTAGAQIAIELSSITDIFFTVGVTEGAPVNGDDTYTNEDLAGKNYRVTQRAYGPLEALKEDESNAATADIVINPSGGFTWLNDVKFSANDKYIITMLTAPFDVSTVPLVPIPDSPIADFVYYHWLRFQNTQTSGIGEVKPAVQNAVMASVEDKLCKAWNDMVNKTQLLYEFIMVNDSVYPEFNDYAICELLTKINRFF